MSRIIISDVSRKAMLPYLKETLYETTKTKEIFEKTIIEGLFDCYELIAEHSADYNAKNKSYNEFMRHFGQVLHTACVMKQDRSEYRKEKMDVCCQFFELIFGSLGQGCINGYIDYYPTLVSKDKFSVAVKEFNKYEKDYLLNANFEFNKMGEQKRLK